MQKHPVEEVGAEAKTRGVPGAAQVCAAGEGTLHQRSRDLSRSLRAAIEAGRLDLAATLLDSMWPSGGNQGIAGDLSAAITKALSSGRRKDAYDLLLRPRGARCDLTFRVACEAGLLDVVEELLRRGYRCAYLHDGDSPVALAARRGQVDLLKLLLDLEVDFPHEPALLGAISSGKLEVLRLLEGHDRAGVRLREHLSACLTVAEAIGDTEMVNYLRQHHRCAGESEGGAATALPRC